MTRRRTRSRSTTTPRARPCRRPRAGRSDWLAARRQAAARRTRASAAGRDRGQTVAQRARRLGRGAARMGPCRLRRLHRRAPRGDRWGATLQGRAFLHSYDWQADAGFGTLELILTAPVVVASWISLQYYGSSVAPRGVRRRQQADPQRRRRHRRGAKATAACCGPACPGRPSMTATGWRMTRCACR